jgi:glycosyltransferase involved in cell wall biosynthesis
MHEIIKKEYSVTVSMISYNDEAIIEDCLLSIRNQDYDQELVNILMVDGGSTDKTLEIAKKYNVIVVSRPDLKNCPTVRGGMGITLPTTDLILSFSADNRLQEKDLLSKMVDILADEDIVACETLRYGYRKNDPVLSRYFALVGGCDPIGISLGRADRGPYDSNKWHTFGLSQDCGEYFKVKFEPNISKIPPIGANGFLVKRSLLEGIDHKETGAHIDMCVSLIRSGRNTFAFIKNRHIVHYINVKIIPFLKRRILYADTYSADKIKREYKVFQKKDILKLTWIIFINITVIIPLLRAIKGYIYVRDIAWFLHPIMCFIFTIGYGWFYLKKLLFFR